MSFFQLYLKGDATNLGNNHCMCEKKQYNAVTLWMLMGVHLSRKDEAFCSYHGPLDCLTSAMNKQQQKNKT